jgi:hypothetical protein
MSSKFNAIDKQTFRAELGNKIATIEEQTAALGQMLHSLKATQRADVTFTTLDDVNAVLSQVGTLRASVEGIKRILRARAATRMREV